MLILFIYLVGLIVSLVGSGVWYYKNCSQDHIDSEDIMAFSFFSVFWPISILLASLGFCMIGGFKLAKWIAGK